MVNRLLILLPGLLFSKALPAQEVGKVSGKLQDFTNDTVAFIKQYMVDKKNAYIGKPLDSLLKDLPPEMPILERS